VTTEASAEWRGLASALHRLERYLEALAALDRAAVLSPDDFAVRFNRGLTLSELGRVTEAVRELEASVQLRSDFAPAWTELGAAKALVGRGQEARLDWNRALTIDSGYIWTRFYRALTSITEGHYRAAADDLDAVTAQERLLSAQLWRWTAYPAGRSERSGHSYRQTVRGWLRSLDTFAVTSVTRGC
jgi:tetratricopeptide (TPR) repeat protein